MKGDVVRIARIVVCRLKTGLKAGATVELVGTSTDVEFVCPGQRREGPWLALVLAGVGPLPHLPAWGVGGKLVIKASDVRRIDKALQQTCNLAAIAHRCQRLVSFAQPCIALIPESDTEREYLECAEGLAYEADVLLSFEVPLSQDQVGLLMKDRPDGVALLAEALSNPDPTGRFHEFMRLFERAFRLMPSRLAPAVETFLAPTRFGYTSAELSSWFDRMRNPATHANRGGRLLLGTHTRQVIARIEQAAYDVLLNKEVWHDLGSARRVIWTPRAFTSSSRGRAEVVVGAPEALRVELVDPFSGVPIDLGGQVPLPGSWWTGHPHREKRTDAFSVTAHRDLPL